MNVFNYVSFVQVTEYLETNNILSNQNQIKSIYLHSRTASMIFVASIRASETALLRLTKILFTAKRHKHHSAMTIIN